jgi:hypothetical protein
MESTIMRRIIIIGVSALALAAPAVASAFPSHISRNPSHITSFGFVRLPAHIVGNLPAHIVGNLPAHITGSDGAGDPILFSTVWGS